MGVFVGIIVVQVPLCCEVQRVEFFVCVRIIPSDLFLGLVIPVDAFEPSLGAD